MTTSVSHERATLGRVVIVGVIGGMIAGMMMAMVEMIYGWAADGHSFWDAPMGIWAWAFGLEHFGPAEDHVDAIVLGMGAHMMNSAMAGVIFAALMTWVIKARDAFTPIVVGMMYGAVIWVVMRYAILPLNEETADLFTTDMISPQWLWWVSHLVLGMTAGVYYIVVSRKFPSRPAS